MNIRLKILRTLNRWFKDPDCGIGLGEALAYGKEVDGTPYWQTLVAWFRPQWWCRVMEFTVCRWRGHNWVDTSSIGPDSGTESGHCERCGWSFYHTYY